MLKALFGLGKDVLFNQALNEFRKLRYLYDDKEKFIVTVLEVIRLCQLAIQRNKSDGDAYVLLANAYYLAALKILGEGYTYCLSQAAAVIYEWKSNRLPTKNRANGEKIYQEVLEAIESPMPDWANMSLEGDMRDMHIKWYPEAINPDSIVKLRKILTTTHPVQTEKTTSDNAGAHILLGALYREQGRLDEAIQQLQTGLRLTPDNPDMHVLLGSLYGEQGRLNEAIYELQTGLRLAPYNVDAHFILGTSYEKQERWDEAIQELQTVVRLDPNNIAVHVPLATAYLRQDQLDKAIREFQIGLNINPNNTDARFLLGRSYQKQGRLQEAIREYKIVLQTNPDEAMIHFTLGELYGEQGQLDEAIRELQAGLYIDPDDSDAHFLLGKFYEQQGHKDKSIGELQIAAKLGSEEAQEILTPSGRVHLVSIHLKWDSNGRLSHELTTNLQIDDYERDDAIAVSAPMLISGQLGILVPHHALVLCTRLLAFLERNEHIIEPINSALKEARIDLWKETHVFNTFHPKTGFLANNNSVEEGVRQLLNNYVGYVSRVVSGDFPKRVRDMLLASMRVYLDVVLSEAQDRRIDPAKGNWNIQKAMSEFSTTLYNDLWLSRRMSDDKFAPLLVETKNLYLEVRRRLGIAS